MRLKEGNTSLKIILKLHFIFLLTYPVSYSTFTHAQPWSSQLCEVCVTGIPRCGLGLRELPNVGNHTLFHSSEGILAFVGLWALSWHYTIATVRDKCLEAKENKTAWWHTLSLGSHNGRRCPKLQLTKVTTYFLIVVLMAPSANP